MNRTIKTPITASGELELLGTSTLGQLMQLGAMVHSAKDTQGGIGGTIQTDAGGLSFLANDADAAMTGIYDAMTAIGDLMAHADARNLNPGTITSVGWLLQGLGEIGLQAQDAREMIEGNLARYRQRQTESREQEVKA